MTDAPNGVLEGTRYLLYLRRVPTLLLLLTKWRITCKNSEATEIDHIRMYTHV